jgi:circadian clock protein KaiC
MPDNVTITRLPTGVPGLDEILGGGLPAFSFNLIAGPPGCGKTTLAHQMMFALATPERPALFMTVLGEPSIKMLRYQQQFDFFDSDKVSRSVHFVNLSEEALTGDFTVVIARIVAEVKKHAPALVFVDSFRSMVLAGGIDASGSARAHSDNDVQLLMQQLSILMTSWHATTFLIGEYFSETDANPVFTVADGLIWMHQSVQRNSMVRKIEVLKMRGQSTLAGLHSFRIGAGGIQVFAPAGKGERKKSEPEAIGERVSTGIARLDDMLGGGLPRGYSMLIAGPSGSGKSILAASFMEEGVRCGETGVLVAFEQRPSRARNRLMDDLIKTGKVGLVDTENDDISIDEVLYWLMKEVRRLNASRVVIDSLSGFELKLAPTFRDDFRESMLRMVTTLAREGVTLLMTSELEDRYIDLRFSPYGTAFLTDAIIVQRYIEVEGRLRRVMAVVKVRASMHSNELREYTINGDGFEVGERLGDQEGLLGGSPTRRHEVDGNGAAPAVKGARPRTRGA